MSDTQIDSIQYLNFAKKWFNSIFNSIVFHENSIQKIIHLKNVQKNSIKKIIQFKNFQKNSIQKIIQFKKFQKNSIQKIIQFNKWGSTDIGWIMINHEYHIFYGILGHFGVFLGYNITISIQNTVFQPDSVQ